MGATISPLVGAGTYERMVDALRASLDGVADSMRTA
jgi:hypothetical protein